MTNSAQHQSWSFNMSPLPATASLAMAIVFVLTVVAPSAQAQSFTVLHSFTGGADGASPAVGLTLDKAGNLYGTASAGGAGYGTVFKLAHSGTGWILNPLYQFQGGADGASPVAALVFGPDGSLYGTTQLGGNSPPNCQYIGGETGCGTVFNLKPPPNRPKSFSNPWLETVIYRFGFWTDGSDPYSEVIFDAAGNLYGTTGAGGLNGDYVRIDGGGGCGNHCGVVYELSPSNGGWTETTLFQFTQETGSNPQAGLIFDQAGNLDGITGYEGQEGLGSIFQLQRSSSGWIERTLHSMQWTDGAYTYSTPILDASGNLYGGNTGYCCYYGRYDGNVFVLNPTGDFSSIYAFPPQTGPYAGLTMDAAGNIYGTTEIGGANNYGVVFKLTATGGAWNYTSLHDFAASDGCRAMGKVTLDTNGNLYGTTSSCGANGYGTVWEITP